MLILLLLAVLLLTYSNGANDNFKGVATLWGSGTLQYRPALILATLTTFAGSICSYFFAAELIKNFPGKELVSDEMIHTVNFILAVALAISANDLLASKFKFITCILDIAKSKFGLTFSAGNIYGRGVLNKTADTKENSKIVLSWVLKLLVAGLLSALLHFVINSFNN